MPPRLLSWAFTVATNLEDLSYTTRVSGHNHLCICSDFSLVFLTHSRLHLEQAAARVFYSQHSVDYWMHLHLSLAKSEVLIFAKLSKIERYPSMRINVTSLDHLTHIKVLGVTINK